MEKKQNALTAEYAENAEKRYREVFF